MPYLILIIGLLIGIYALIRFFSNAKPEQIRAFFRGCIIALYILILLFFAVTGRIIVSIALLTLAIPFIISYFKGKITKKNEGLNKDEK